MQHRLNGPPAKPRIIFVGGFGERPGIYGGQISACTSLMRSDFADAFEVVQIDSTQESVPPPPVWRRVPYALSRLWRFASRTLRRRPDAALIFLADGLGFIEKAAMAHFARICGVRVVIAPRSGFLIEQYQRSVFLRRIIRSVFGVVDAIVCQSRYWADHFSQMGATAGKCVVIMNWVEQSPFREAVDLPACGGELRLGFLGWVERSKGIFDLLEAMAALRGRGRRVFLEVAGYGGGFAVAQKRVEELGIADAVRFSGWLSGPEKLRFLSECHVLVLPSYGEGLPNAMLEAMAAGRPVIATNVGGIPDVLAGSGAGILHEPGDVPALVAAIETYYEDRSILVAAGAKARTIALRDHAIENAARRLRDCLLGRGAEVT